MIRVPQRFFGFNYPCPRNLREVVKISTFTRQPAHIITNLWKQFHDSKPHTCGTTLSAEEYERFSKNTEGCPMFVFPLAKDKGHFVMVSQAQKKTVMLTFLQEFKHKGPQATPYMVFTLYDELLTFKRLGLIRGDIVALKILTQSDGNWLMNELLNFYLTSDFEKVTQFNHDPNNFKYEEYIAESVERQRAWNKE